MYSNGCNIYLFICSNALWCHYYVIIVFVYNLLQNGRTRRRKDWSVNGSTSVETLWFRSECPTWVRQTWSSLILVQRSIVHTIVSSSWEKVCCLISKQDVANTYGHINRMVCQCTQHVTPQIIWRKRRLISSSLICGPQTAPILILLTVLLGVPSGKSLPWMKI